MKKLLPPLLVLGALLAFALWNSAAMEARTSRWQDQLRQADALAQSGDWAAAEAALAEYVGEYQFFLGLQMGLELGAMDLLGDEEDDVWEQLEFSS